jgi:16S rRNA U1498 N3-methylase RsmE
MTTLDRLIRVAARVGTQVIATIGSTRVVLAESIAGAQWRYCDVAIDEACRQVANRAGVGSVACREEQSLDALLDLAWRMQEGGSDE